MPIHTIPDLHFDHFKIAEILDLFNHNKILINEAYQRGEIWKVKQRTELISSIMNSYSIGVLVLFKNNNGQYEILDGQQRLLTIKRYLNDDLDLDDTSLPKYSSLNTHDKAGLNAYCIFYLQLNNIDPDKREEDIVQTFLRLQEGTPLNKAEKINAYRGQFKDKFRTTRETHPIFNYLGKEKRFRWRQLAAEMLLIELEGDFEKKAFPDIDLPSLIYAIKKYENRVPSGKFSSYIGILNTLNESLNMILSAFTSREMIAFFLLVSYLRKRRAGNERLINELPEFAKEFLKNLNSFSIYDSTPPPGMDIIIFERYRNFKQESKILTLGTSLRNRLDIMLQEFDRIHPILLKDPNRLHDAEQKRILYFRQKGICPECRKELQFKSSSSHHEIAHSRGGKTGDLSNALLLHEKCHRKLEERKAKLLK